MSAQIPTHCLPPRLEDVKAGLNFLLQDLFRCDLYADRSRVERIDPDDKTGKTTLPADPSYPLRCIFAPVKKNGVIVIDSRTGKPEQSADEHTFFENMSRAMARQCDVFASLMTTPERTDIPMGGIWGTVEFEELQLENNPGKVDIVSLLHILRNFLVFWSLRLTSISLDRLV